MSRLNSRKADASRSPRGTDRPSDRPARARSTEPRSDGLLSTDVRAFARAYALVNVIGGLVTLLGPAVYGNDDGLVNRGSGLFLGVVAVNGRHSVLHLLHGLQGLRASADRDSARTHLRRSVAFFALFAAVGWHRFGFERGIHAIAGIAVDGWGNLAHALLSALGAFGLVRTGSTS